MVYLALNLIQIVKITKILLTLHLILIFCDFSHAQSSSFRFQELLQQHPKAFLPFAISNTNNLKQLLGIKEINVKQATKDWIFVQATPEWINFAQENKLIETFYHEFSNPKALNDSTRLKHFVNQVQLGQGGLQVPFTGKDVLYGFVDTGIDFNHPDFKDSNGNSRCLYYWDQSLPYDALRTPQPYGYGQLWTNSDIQQGICTSMDNSGHGSTVAGASVANGLANGKNKGMAPDAKIIAIQTDFSVTNWTLTVADACDFIFKKADELGIPAVVNLSVGDYLGSHDGNDPAALLMDSLIDAKPGRIIVCAAGNAGTWGKYHVHGDVDADTSFVWLIPNPASQLAVNSVYFDVWTDTSLAQWEYAFGANLSSGTFEERSTTIFRNASFAAGGTTKDTLWNNGNKLAAIEITTSIIGPNLHLEIFLSSVDSSSYLYSFKTKGAGAYDGWSGSSAIQLNDMMTSGLPSPSQYPPIIHYHLPDSLQTIVSSWACSPKVVTVGNIRNRYSHINKNGDVYLPVPPNYTGVGQLTPASSKGPTKNGIIKPDIVACGDVSLSAGPLWFLANSANNTAIDIDGFHVRNGGTSMASPVVAGIAALYLEKCSQGTYQTFQNAMKTTAFTDMYTGVVPNNAYGYGKIHALNLMLQSNYTSTITAPSTFCPGDSAFAIVAANPYTIIWNTGDTTHSIPLISTDTLSYKAFGVNKCISYSDTLIVTALSAPPAPVIYVNGSLLSTDPYPQLQWYENNVAIPGANGSTYSIVLPSTSIFTVSRISIDGCEVFSLPYSPSLELNQNNIQAIHVFPNPTNNVLNIDAPTEIQELAILDLQGRVVQTYFNIQDKVDISSVSNGTYYLKIKTENKYFHIKIVKN